MKTKNDFVTVVDRESETIILADIQKKYPTHAIFSEEAGQIAGSGLTWVVDPLDGTRNYLGSIPLFCVSIAVCFKGAPVAGAIYAPTRDELFSAGLDRGAYFNGKKIRTSPTRNISESFLGMGIPYRAIGRIKEYTGILRRLSLSRADHRRSGSCALDLAYVASGRFDGFWAMGQEPWDFSAGKLIIEEAGGRVSDFSGKPLTFQRSDIVASNGPLHAEILKLIQSRS